jgi:hypothetical protein
MGKVLTSREVISFSTRILRHDEVSYLGGWLFGWLVGWFGGWLDGCLFV